MARSKRVPRIFTPDTVEKELVNLYRDARKGRVKPQDAAEFATVLKSLAEVQRLPATPA